MMPYISMLSMKMLASNAYNVYLLFIFRLMSFPLTSQSIVYFDEPMLTLYKYYLVLERGEVFVIPSVVFSR